MKELPSSSWTMAGGGSLVCGCCNAFSYTTQPPSLPRRLLFENRLAMYLRTHCRNPRMFGCALLTSIIVAYAILDYHFFTRYSTENLREVSKHKPESFELFNPTSIKWMMEDPTTQYGYTYTCELFNNATNFSNALWFITPNMITLTHLALGFFSGKFVASDNLDDRRVGVLIFHVRSWLDSLDGVVYRAHSKSFGSFKSDYSSLGYFVDIFSDIAGGCFLMFGVLYHLMKRFRVSRQCPCAFDYPVGGISEDEEDLLGMKGSALHNSSQSPGCGKVVFRAVAAGCILIVNGIFWDPVIINFTDGCTRETLTPGGYAAQNEACHTTLFIVLIFIWRNICNQAMLQYILLIVWMDKTWEFATYAPLPLITFLCILFGLCKICYWNMLSAITAAGG